MKTLKKTRKSLIDAGRWDIDFHLPPEGIKAFPDALLRRVDEVADVVRMTRDPSARPEESFKYVDISSVEVTTGSISGPQDLTGDEAPSRARKVIRAFDIVVSTVRPTRGAVAVVPPALHNEIASTGFSIVRPHSSTNPFYLHFALRLEATREQLRKWSTGSSYPAILDEDVAKTLIPVPDEATQDQIAKRLMDLSRRRSEALARMDEEWAGELRSVTREISGQEVEVMGDLAEEEADPKPHEWDIEPTIDFVSQMLSTLPDLTVDAPARRRRRRNS